MRLRQQDVDLPQLRDDLLRLVLPMRYPWPMYPTTPQGAYARTARSGSPTTSAAGQTMISLVARVPAHPETGNFFKSMARISYRGL